MCVWESGWFCRRRTTLSWIRRSKDIKICLFHLRTSKTFCQMSSTSRFKMKISNTTWNWPKIFFNKKNYKNLLICSRPPCKFWSTCMARSRKKSPPATPNRPRFSTKWPKLTKPSSTKSSPCRPWRSYTALTTTWLPMPISISDCTTSEPPCTKRPKNTWRSLCTTNAWLEAKMCFFYLVPRPKHHHDESVHGLPIEQTAPVGHRLPARVQWPNQRHFRPLEHEIGGHLPSDRYGPFRDRRFQEGCGLPEKGLRNFLSGNCF